MAINDLYTAHFRFEGAGGGFTSSMSYEQTSGTNDENTLTELATSLGVILSASFKNCMSDQINMTGITLFQTTGADETPGRTVFELPNPGDVSSEAIPLGGAAVLSILTDAPNAKFNGRMFVGGIPELGQSYGVLEAAYKITLDGLATLLQVTPPAVGPGLAVFRPCVISRVLDGAPRVPFVGFQIIAISINPFIKNQRRRNTKFIGAGASTP